MRRALKCALSSFLSPRIQSDTTPMMYGPLASPNKCERVICHEFAILRFRGSIIYRSMSTFIALFRQTKVMVMKRRIQERAREVLMRCMPSQNRGMAPVEPMAQMRASARPDRNRALQNLPSRQSCNANDFDLRIQKQMIYL